MKSRYRILAALLSFLICQSAASIINVPDDQATIQDGINATVNGDTLRVAPGTYSENITFNGKLITVTSSPPSRFLIEEKFHSALDRDRSVIAHRSAGFAMYQELCINRACIIL